MKIEIKTPAAQSYLLADIVPGTFVSVVSVLSFYSNWSAGDIVICLGDRAYNIRTASYCNVATQDYRVRPLEKGSSVTFTV